MAKAIFQSFPNARAARLRSGILDAFTIIGVNLLEARGGLQFRGRITQNFLIGNAVENPPPFHIHDCDHVGGVLAYKVKQLFPIDQLTADSVNQKVLIDRVEIEEEYQADQTPDSLRQYGSSVEIFVKVGIREEKGGQSHGKQQRDDSRGCP